MLKCNRRAKPRQGYRIWKGLTGLCELDISGLRSWPLDRDPHLIFYIEREDHIEVWRVLNGKCDVPAWLLGAAVHGYPVSITTGSHRGLDA